MVLLGFREKEFALVERFNLMDRLKQLFPPGRVQLYRDGRLKFPARKELINRAMLIVNVSLNLLSDMIFMPPGGIILEIRPAELADPIYHFLSDVCSLDYYLLLAGGGNRTLLKQGIAAERRAEAKELTEVDIQQTLQQVAQRVMARVEANKKLREK